MEGNFAAKQCLGKLQSPSQWGKRGEFAQFQRDSGLIPQIKWLMAQPTDR